MINLASGSAFDSKRTLVKRAIVKSGVSASELGGDLVDYFHLDSIFEFHSGNHLRQLAEAA